MAQNRLAETGVSAANKTATRQASANSLRKEIIDFDYSTSYTSLTPGMAKRCYPFRWGNNSLNAADEDDLINS